MAPQPPCSKIGDYQLVRLLGKGGMGEVWLASDIRADRPVAVKFIKAGYLDDPAVRTRFLNEARTLGRLEQDRIVTLYNVVEDGSALALVLRFIDGISLADRIDEEGALPIDFVLASARDILPALGFAHEHGVIHRDIKPQNVLVDRQQHSFLTDFGIAIGDFAERGTVTGFAVGTPHYMSPEQIQTPRQITIQNGGHRSDIYSYGVVLYEMLTGQVPFCSQSGVEEIYKIQHAHCVEAPRPLRDVNPQIPAVVEDTVLRCLAKNPNDRPQSCAELLKEFEAAILDGSSAVRNRSSSAVRAATIVERQPSAGKPPVATPAPAEAVRPAARPRSRGIPKAAWLGVGGLAIAGGITYAIVSANKPVTQKSVNPTEQTATPAKPSEAAPAPDTTRTSIAKAPANTTPPPNPVPAQSPKTLAPTTASDPRAATSYGQALDYQRKQMPCQGVSAINDAVQRDPSNQKYLILQNQLKRDCATRQGAENDYIAAKRLFDQGDYCEGKGSIDRAVSIDHTNKTYLDLQQRLRKGCSIQ